MRIRNLRLTTLSVAVVAVVLAGPLSVHADFDELFLPDLPDWVSAIDAEPEPASFLEPVDRTPGMLGDTFVGLLDVNIDNDGILSSARISFPGGANRLVVARNNSALVRDRFYVAYEHTTGALSTSSQAATDNGANLDRTILGLEKVFLDGQASIEIRLPFAAERSFRFNRFSIQNDGEFGNIGLIGKLQIVKNEHAVVSSGIAIQLPTGGDITGEFDGNAFRIENDAVYVSPFLSFAAAPNSDWFWQGFMQTDHSVRGNTFVGLGQSGELDNQTLLRLSGGGGRWFFLDNDGLLQGLAGIVELHYTSTLDSPDSVVFTNMARVQTLSNASGHQDILNLTSGLHLELPGNANARVGVNVPLRGDQRFHNATLMVQVNVGL